MSESYSHLSLWSLATPETLAFAAGEFFEDPEDALGERLDRARAGGDPKEIQIFEEAL